MHAPNPVIVVSDVHLARGARREVGRALEALVRNHPGHEIVLNGDSFDLSVEPRKLSAKESVVALLSEHAELVRALREHLARGVPVTLVDGNHDAEVALPEVHAAMKSVLELTNDAPLHSAAWFVRRSGVHVEHGHLYDPDNAPNHPLITWSRETEPLGIALMRRFVAPARAFEFAHSHESTPLASVLRTFSLYGARAPAVVLRYFATAFSLAAEAGRQPGLDDELSSGESGIAAFAEARGLEIDALREVLFARPNPTHHRASDTFFRLYLDRSLATLGLLGTSALALGGSAGAAVGAAACAAYLGWSLARGVNRYGGRLEPSLRDAAGALCARTGAKLVVFGHSHKRDAAAGYLNPGSFAFPDGPGRGYVHVDVHGHAENRAFFRTDLG